MTRPFTLLDEGQPRSLQGSVDRDRVILDPASVQAALGWHLTPDGLCRGNACIPTRGLADRLRPDGIDLATLATALERPLACEPAFAAAALGTSVAERAQELDGLAAPDLTLTDLHGAPRRLDSFRGQKVFLLAFASW